MAENENGTVLDEGKKEYKVVKAQPNSYFDSTGNPVNGFRIIVEFITFKETHTFDVPDLKPETVRPIIKDFLRDRKALDEL